MTAAQRLSAGLVAASLLGVPCATPASAANPMGYQLLSPDQAASLPHRRGALGMEVERAQQVSDDGMTFDIIRVTNVHQGSAGAQAGFSRGDEIVAIDGLVFPSIRAFAAYVGSLPPGTRARVDYIPAGGGPAQAQRVTVLIGGAGQPAPSAGGMSTREKIGLGVAALAGCYMLGCFSKRTTPSQQQQPYPAQPQ